MTGCDPNEVLISTLKPGACFEMLLTAKHHYHGVVVEHCVGSTLVDLGFERTHWCSEAQVVSHPEAQAKEWLSQTKKENKEMAKGKREKKARNLKLATRGVIRFEVGETAPLEKYLDEKNTAYSALMYRAIKEVGKPITFAEIWNEIYRSVSNKTEGKTPKATLSVILQKMVKDGYVKRSEVQEAKAVAA